MTNPSKPLENGERDASGKFLKGHKGGPGRSPLPKEVRDALAADTLPRYRRCMELSKKAEKDGDIKTAANIELALLRKQIPDLSAVELTGADGEPIEVRGRLDVTKLSSDELAELRKLMLKARTDAAREES